MPAHDGTKKIRTRDALLVEVDEMASRQSWFETVRVLGGFLLAFRGRMGLSWTGGRGGDRSTGRRAKWIGGRVDQNVLAELERRKSLAILHVRTAQIR